jgi:hypothetical protein
MKYAGMMSLKWLDRAICNLYDGCKIEKQNNKNQAFLIFI